MFYLVLQVDLVGSGGIKFDVCDGLGECIRDWKPIRLALVD